MTQELFRKEALEARRTGWLGSISLVQPLPLVVLMAFAVLAAVSVCLFLVIGTYTKRSTVAGQLIPKLGMATVVAPTTGIVVRIKVSENGKVSAGQMVAVIRAPRATVGNGNTHTAMSTNLAQRQKSLKASLATQQTLLNVKDDGLREQLISVRAELAQIEATTETRHKQDLIAREVLARLKVLQNKHYVSELKVKEQQTAVLDQVSALQTLKQQAIVARRSILQLKQELEELPSRRTADLADYQRNTALLSQEQLKSNMEYELAVMAPVSGVVATQLVKPGQAVKIGQPLISLLPGDGVLEAELAVPSRAIGFIEPGDTVLLRYQAYPYQKFGHQEGKVMRIGRSAVTLDELGMSVDNIQQDEPVYRVIVTLERQTIIAYGKPESLKPGMLLQADVLGEKRRLIEWVFEPLYSLMGKMSSG